MSEHATLSASGASRWLNCPPSARYEQHFPVETSPYAEEGTRAHTLAATLIDTRIGRAGPDAFDLAIDQISPDQEMIDSAESFANAVLSDPNVGVYVERRVNFSRWVPHGFGTSDAITFTENGAVLNIFDLKYGRGVPVSAENNPQIRLYALGSLHTLGWLYDVERVRMTILQPRLDGASTQELPVADLLAWGESIKPTAADAIAGHGDFNPGPHCRFCRARHVCEARANANLELARWEFSAPVDLDNEQIGEILDQAKDFEVWIKDIRKHAMALLLRGVEVAGWKVVAGRSQRVYTDPEQVIGVLADTTENEDELDDLAPRAPLGITAMTKKLGKKRFDELLKAYLTKPPGAPTLAPESDKRKPMKPAEHDFKEES